ncbi:N-acyl homoserine lactonase family protein [Microbacterium testaceum]|uniref:N-acyl homoserine lactonase family protein n=1 Tax=Microbacterium testaceum TaxID=2033 RepID=UPI001D171185|nr:N-acyl homoserine lactonase family protein [Microbacterium testaceum]MCC4247773.1 N-acyl homoserine lactonase family protein [Microbacterium testaceum]
MIPAAPCLADAAVALCAAGGETWEVLAVRQGSLLTRRSHVFLNHDVYGEPDGPLLMTYSFWVLRNAGRVVLVDAGMSENGARSRGREYERSTTAALAGLGMTPDDVSEVIVSHAHYDHIGGLSELSGRPVTMAAAEYAFWGTDRSRRPLLRSVVDEVDLEHLDAVRAAGRLTLVEGVHEAAPGIVLLPAPGHTPGELAVLVRTTTGVVILACDAVHLDEELDRDMPFRHQTDLLEMYETLEMMRALRNHPAVTAIVSGHDGAVASRHPSRAGSEHVTVIAER